MNDATLTAALQDPKVVAEVLDDYSGPYAFGVTEVNGRAALCLRVVAELVRHKIPREIMIDGEPITVVVDGGFRQPTAGPYRIRSN